MADEPRTPAPMSIGGGWTFVLAIGAVAGFGVAGYEAVVQHLPLTDRLVFVPLLAGVWFAVRVALRLAQRR